MGKALGMARKLVEMLEEKESNEKVQLSTIAPGGTFLIGKHEFIVLNHGSLGTEVVAKELMKKDVVFGDSKNYKESKIKEIVENKIQPFIECNLGEESIVEHEVSLTSVDMQNEYGSCKCKVRLMTFDEVRAYNNLLVDNELPDWWWTLTPWSTEERGWKYGLAVVSPSGYVNNDIYYYDCGVRPFCILKSDIFVSLEGEK